jgi:probable rRNA maturation factor
MNVEEDILGDPRVTVFGSNEQLDVECDVTRYVTLARLTLAREQVVGTSEMSLILCDEDAISRLNEQYMDAKGPTDVLAFPVDDDIVGSGRNPDNGGRGPGTPSEDDDIPQLIGDVYVCPAIAAAQAPDHKNTFDQEMALLVVHGTLHLLNYDHYEEDEREEMQAREREILGEFFQRYPNESGR